MGKTDVLRHRLFLLRHGETEWSRSGRHTGRTDLLSEWDYGDYEGLTTPDGHFSRAVLTCWVQLPVAQGIRFAMAPASIAVCRFEHGVRQVTALGLTGYPHPCLP